jgi:hypothetical protein
MAHTPGPWKVIHKYEDSWHADGFIVEGGLGTHIVPDGTQLLGDELADYRLISAAPDLLDACTKAVPVLEELERMLSNRIGWTSVSFPELVALRAALEKAVAA